MYQSNPELVKLQQEQASVEQKLQQLQHNQQRLENRKSYYEKANRKKRTHRLCTIAGTMESIAPEIKELTLPEVTNLLESIMDPARCAESDSQCGAAAPGKGGTAYWHCFI